LFPISDALLSRFKKVRIPPPSLGLEEKIVLRQMRLTTTQKRNESNWIGRIFRRSRSDADFCDDRLRQHVIAYLQTMQRIREIGRESAAKECAFGVRGTIDLFSSLAGSTDFNEIEIGRTIDRAIAADVVEQVTRAPVEVIRQILESQIEWGRYPESKRVLTAELNRQGMIQI